VNKKINIKNYKSNNIDWCFNGASSKLYNIFIENLQVYAQPKASWTFDTNNFLDSAVKFEQIDVKVEI
jgi:hypothetical protein